MIYDLLRLCGSMMDFSASVVHQLWRSFYNEFLIWALFCPNNLRYGRAAWSPQPLKCPVLWIFRAVTASLDPMHIAPVDRAIILGDIIEHSHTHK